MVSIRFFINLFTIFGKDLGFSNTSIKNTLEGTIQNINGFNCQSTYCGARNESENKLQFLIYFYLVQKKQKNLLLKI